MTRMRQYLPYAEWPEEDRRLWDTLFKKRRGPFEDCGRGAHLSERSQRQLQYVYGKFLKFVAVRHPDRLGCSPAARVSANMIEQFVKFQPAACGDVTISIYLYHLWLVLKYIYPRRPRAHPLAARGAFARQRWANYGVCDGTPAQVLPADEAALLLLGSSVAPSSRPEASHTRGRRPPPFPRDSALVGLRSIFAVPHLAQSSEHPNTFTSFRRPTLECSDVRLGW
jgi:hypothetical protein